MKIGSLFSGYGGLDMACEAAFGATTAWVSDIDPGSCKILAHHYPDAPNLGDITAIDWSTVEQVDIITGGSPCQDLSHAGKRGGMTEGTRSNLWVAMRTAIAQLRPTYVVWENVRGAYSAEADSDLGPCPGCLDDPRERGPVLRALGRVLGDLSDLGYDCRWVGLRASDVGFAHGRFRVFVVAHARSSRRDGQTWAFRPAGRTESADSRLLPTPTTRDVKGHNQRRDTTSLTGALLPTPSAADALGGHLSRSGARSSELLLPGVAKQLGTLLPLGGERSDENRRQGQVLLPTPRATDGTKGGPNQRDSSGDLMLPSAVARLLPTPAVNDMGAGKTVEARDAWTATQKAKHGNGNGHGASLHIEALRLLPTPTVADFKQSGGNPATSNVTLTDATVRARMPWGDYADAIARQESVTRPAPPPTEPAPRGGQRLSCRFDEWLMGLPDGWITDVPGITHNEALKACGNGVVPQQAYVALTQMLAAQAVAA